MSFVVFFVFLFVLFAWLLLGFLLLSDEGFLVIGRCHY